MERSEERSGERSGERAPRWWSAVQIALAVWCFAVLAYGAGLAFEGYFGDLGCEAVPSSSLYGERSTTFVPPGLECRFDERDVPDGFPLVTQEPGPVTVLFQLALLAVPLGAWFLTRRLPAARQRGARLEILSAARVVGALLCLGWVLSWWLSGNPVVLLRLGLGAAALGLVLLTVAIGRLRRAVDPVGSSAWPT